MRPSALAQPLTVMESLPDPPITRKRWSMFFWQITFIRLGSNGSPVSSTLKTLSGLLIRLFSSSVSLTSSNHYSRTVAFAELLALAAFSCSGRRVVSVGCLFVKPASQSWVGKVACFALMTASFIQGELGRSGTTFSFSGACLFRRPRRVALYRSRRSSTPSGEPITRRDWAISARNSDLSMPLTFLHFTTLRGTRGLKRSVPIVSKKWSDMYRLSTLTEVTSVMTTNKTHKE